VPGSDIRRGFTDFTRKRLTGVYIYGRFTVNLQVRLTGVYVYGRVYFQFTGLGLRGFTMTLSRERMAAYQRGRRAKLKVSDPIKIMEDRTGIKRGPCAGCIKRDEVIYQQRDEIKGLTAALPTVGSVGACKGCSDRDSANMVLRAKVLMLEKELGLLKREKKVILGEDVQKSPYRLGPGV
jgi:hypothetical protein